MKNFFLLCLITFPIILIGQNCIIPTNELGLFEISRVVDTQEHSEIDIYKTALVSSSASNLGFTGNRSYEDKELGVFITELDVPVKTKLYSDVVFVFEVKVEAKDNKYRTSVSYKYSFFGEECRCTNDLASERCNPVGCAVFNSSWNKLKCAAIEQLDSSLTSYEELIAVNLQKLDW